MGAHNIKPYQAPDGTFLIFYVGSINHEKKDCSNITLNFEAAPLPKEAAGPVMVASAKRVDDPPEAWIHHGPLTDSVAWHSATNPTVVWEDDGSISMWVARRWSLGGGRNTKNDWKMAAQTWKGPYHNITTKYEDAVDAGEDPH